MKVLVIFIPRHNLTSPIKRFADDDTVWCVYVAYMEIGSGNLSAVIGPYRQAIATATLKFGIPYFVVDIGEPSSVVEPFGGSTIPLVSKPYNLISVLPHPSELYSAIVDVLATLQWTRLAVIYEDQTQGLNLTTTYLNASSFLVVLMLNQRVTYGHYGRAASM